MIKGINSCWDLAKRHSRLAVIPVIACHLSEVAEVNREGQKPTTSSYFSSLLSVFTAVQTRQKYNAVRHRALHRSCETLRRKRNFSCPSHQIRQLSREKAHFHEDITFHESEVVSCSCSVCGWHSVAQLQKLRWSHWLKNLLKTAAKEKLVWYRTWAVLKV